MLGSDSAVYRFLTFTMYFKIRKIGAKPGEDDLIANLSKTAAIQELRNFIFERLNVEVKKQILLYKGKQVNN